MAKRLTSRPAWAGVLKHGAGTRGLYPWTEWITIPKGKDVGMVLLEHGTDFTISPEMMRQSTIQAAHRLGFTIKTNVNKDSGQVLITTTGKKK
jgi:hypothetical protein